MNQYLIGRKKTVIFLAGLALFFCATVHAEHLPVKTYTVADGLPRDMVYKIKQDSRGFLWFCTMDGISRFDGYAFTNFTTNDGLPDRHVNDFLETKSGTIFIATDGGLARLNPKGLANSKDNPLFTLILPDNPKAKAFQFLFEDETGVIWAGTSDGLYTLNERRELAAVDLGPARPDIERLFVSAIIKDRRGVMWIGTYGALFRLLPSGEVHRFTKANGLPETSISTLHEDKNGRIWVGTRPGTGFFGLSLLVSEPEIDQEIVERKYAQKDGLPSAWITDLLESSDGKFWVGTTSGLCEWQGGETSVCKTYTTGNGLCSENVWTIAEDKDKNLWVGSRCGTKKWARYGFTSYFEEDGLGYKMADSIFENAAGELFVSFNKGSGRMVSRFDGEKFELAEPRFPSNINYYGWGWKQTVWQDRSGDWFFPTGDGLFRFAKPTRFEELANTAPQKIEFGANGKEIFRFFEDSRGDFWIASGSPFQLWHWERSTDTWRDITLESGIGKNSLGTSFVEDDAGNLWIGTGSDSDDTTLIRYRDGYFHAFTQAENALLTGWIRDLFVDHAGRLWIANTITGLLRLDDVNAGQLNFVRYTLAEGLSTLGVSCVTEDEFGRIYVGTGRGIDRLDPETGQIENFTTADGLPNSNIEVSLRDRNNNLWFGTTNGLARLVPEPKKDRQPPNVLITGLRVNGEPQSVSILGETTIPQLDLKADQRQVTVDFVGLGASLGEKMRYEYRFDDSDWTAAGERTLNFANLASGNYQFEVRTVTADRIYSQPAAVAFKIAAPIWQRWWFIAGLLALTAVLIYVFYRYRLARLLELERIRTRIATDLHDDIGANLTRIALLTEVANQQTQAGAGNGKRNLLPSIAEIARESVASMNDIVWAISPDHDSLLDLTRRMRQHAEEVFAYRDIDLEFHAPSPDNELKLSVGVRRDLLLIFKEAANNAVKHSACTKVIIDFSCKNSILSLRIKDNGKGFDGDPESDGQGLSSMTRRAKALGGKLKIDSRNGAGTDVEFEMSLPKASFESRI